MNAPSPAPFPSTTVLVGVSAQPLRICLDFSTPRPDCSCLSASMDAPRLAPSSLSPSLAPAALQLPSIGPLSHMLGLAYPYLPKSLCALDQVFSSSFSSLFRTDRRPQLYSLFSMSTRLHYTSEKPILLTIPPPLAVV